MNGYSLTVLNLYPDLLNLCGDTGNVSVIKMRCQKRKINAVCRDICSSDTPDLSDADIIIIGGGGERETIAVSKMPVSDMLKEYVQRGGVILATCSGYQLLGNTFQYGDKIYSGFNALPVSSVAADERYMGDAVIEATLNGRKVIIAGFENHAVKTDGGDSAPLGRVICGMGDRGEAEGVMYKNVIATNIYGPLLPANPELADYMIAQALKNKYKDFDGCLTQLDDSAEMNVKQFITDRNKGARK